MTGRRVLQAVVVMAWIGGNAAPATGQSADSAREGTAGFLRGDVNCDGGVDISDPLSLFGSLFLGEDRVCCNSAADSDNDARVDLSDGVLLLNYLALGGQAPATPFPECGLSPTERLSCRQESCPASTTTPFTFFGNTYEANSVVFAIGRSAFMGLRASRQRVAAELKEELGGLPPNLPFDLVYYDGEKGATLSSSGAPDVLLSTAKTETFAMVDRLFEARAPGDDLVGLFRTATECARRGAGEQVIIYVGDGWDASFGVAAIATLIVPDIMNGILDEIRALNHGDSIPIHAVGVHWYTRAMSSVMRILARQNAGSFNSTGTLFTRRTYTTC